jgi:predicted kinase
MLIGPPGSGKSTFARKLIEQQKLGDHSYIANDKIAKELFGVTTDRGDKDGAIFAEQDRRLAALLESGKVAIVDATNVKHEARQRLIAIANTYARPITAFCFRRNIETLLRKNRSREVEVSEAMVKEYANLMQQVSTEELHDEGIELVIDVPQGI